MFEKFKPEGFAEFEDGTRLYDEDVIQFVKKHLRLRDTFNIPKIVVATLEAFVMLQHPDTISNDENWKF